MHVIPAINVETVDEAAALLKRAALFVPAGEWIHVDVNEQTAYGEWLAAKHFLDALGHFSLEVHCMRLDWQACFAAWLAAGAKRAIVPVRYIQGEAPLEIMPSFELCDLPETFPPSFFSHPTIQILAVQPGVSGKAFNESVLEKIRVVRRLAPHAIIEVDGGITLDTGRWILEAGADAIVSSSYIWDSDDPGKAYRELTMIQDS